MGLRERLLSYAREISQKPFFAKFIRWMIVNLNSLFLGAKIYQSEHLFVVQHPKPAYPVHYLILPKSSIENALALEQHIEFWKEVPSVIQYLVEKFVQSGDGYRIITNGGAYQEMPILHIHFISGESND